MVQREIQELLLHQSITVTLHYRAFSHSLHIGKRVVSLTLASLGGLDWSIKCAVLVRQVCIRLIARLVVKATQRNIILIHSADVVVGRLVNKSAFVGFLQCGFRYGIHLVPQAINPMVSFVVGYHLLRLCFRIKHIVHSSQSGQSCIVSFAIYQVKFFFTILHSLLYVFKSINRILV